MTYEYGRRKLYRSDDSVIAGVCGGIADYFDMSAWGVRALFILAFILTGFFPLGIVYIILAFSMKRAPSYYYSRSFRE